MVYIPLIIFSGGLLAYDAFIERVDTWQELSYRTLGFTKKVQISGTIKEKLYKNERNQAYRLNIDNIDNISTHKNMAIIVEFPRNIRVSVGQTLMHTGRIEWVFDGQID
jgi:hypothetical protein